MKRHALHLLLSSLLILSGCSVSGAVQETAEIGTCPNNEVLICHGGRAAQGARIYDREPRICECQSPANLVQ